MNRQLRRNDETCSWQLDFSAEKLQPQLVMASTAGYAQLPDLFGLFKSPRDAKRALQALVDEHGLCAATLGVEPVRPGSPCFAHQVKKCRGACVGKESPQTHAARVAAALGKLKLTPWPFHGPAALREGEDLHLVDRWCYLGTVREEQEFATLLDDGHVEFDADIYRILVKVQAKLQPLTGLKSRRWRDGA
jgi:DNA polymerase-3 subunit epsilon